MYSLLRVLRNSVRYFINYGCTNIISFRLPVATKMAIRHNVQFETKNKGESLSERTNVALC
jgi:hypothetical protein